MSCSPGAVSHEVTQFGSGAPNSFTLPATGGPGGTNLSLGVTPIANTIEGCGFAGYFITVAAVDDCGNRSTSATAIGLLNF
jgi:hypothetical protein